MKKPINKEMSAKIMRFLESFGLSFLFSVCGVLALLEARRIQLKLHVDNYFAGPSGYMSILGVILLLLFIPEIKNGIKKYRQLTEVAEKEAKIEKTKEEVEEAEKGRKDSIRMWVVFGMLVVYIAVMKYLGFFISSIIFMIVSMFYLGNKWKTVLITTLAIGVFLYFCPQIGITLPKGIFGI